MTIIDFVLLLVVAGVIGAIGQAIAGFERGGTLVAIAVGFIGAFIGAWLAQHFKLPDFYVLHVAGKTFPIVWSIIGSTLFVIVIGLLTRRRV